MAVTVSDVAKRAGVSRAAVSKALNDKPDISQAVKRKIKRIAHEMGYTVNIAAKALSTNKTGTIGIIVGFPQIPTVAERIIGIQEKAAEAGYLALTTFHSGKLQEEIDYLEKIKNRVDGLIMTPINPDKKLINALKSLSMPLVLMNEMLEGFNADFVGDDDEYGGEIGGKHLLTKTNKHIAYFGNNEKYYSDNSLIRGIKRAYEETGRNLNLFSNYWDNFSKENTEKNVAEALAKNSDLEGIFAFSDMTALWIIDYLSEQGVSVPEDIKVIGYDDIEFAKMSRISLTSIAQPNREIGRSAAAMLIERIKADNLRQAAPRKTIFPPELKIRQSSC